MTTAYTESSFGGVLRADGTFVPKDPANKDYAAYLDWLSEGNTVTPSAAAPVSSTLTPYEFLELFTPSEQLAIQTVCNSNMALLVGLTTGIASGSIDLTSASVINWVNAVATAGAITGARATAILAA